MSETPETAEAVAGRNRHNYIVNFLDGAFFWYGYSFIAPGIILPLFVNHFTDNKLLIGLVAMISSAGWFLPQLFTANWVERAPIKKDIVVKTGFFTERLPTLLLPGTALLAMVSPVLSLVTFFIVFAWHTLGAGFIAVAWQDMIAKVIPLARRGLFMGLTTSGGTATGVVGAMVAARMLDRYPFPLGYVIAFGIGGLCVLASWFWLALAKEVPDPPKPKAPSNREYWQRLPGILRRDANYRNYILAMLLTSLGGMGGGFLAVYAVSAWSLSDGQVGVFTAWLMVGQALGNLLCGFLGDRKGYRLVAVVSVLTGLLAWLGSLVAPVPAWFNWVFALRGFSFGGFFIASMIVLEFSVAEIRPTYIGINNSITGVVGLVAPLLGGWIAQVFSYQALFFTSFLFTELGLFWLLAAVREPRHSQPTTVKEALHG